MALTQITEKGIKDGEIVDADINASAAIAKSKLASLDVVNADINASAAIAKSKIENLINNNADNRVITGSGTANTLNGESSVLIDANGKLLVGTTSSSYQFHVDSANLAAEISVDNDASNFKTALNTTNSVNADFNVQHKTNLTSIGTGVNIPLCFHTNGGTNANSAERMRIDTSGQIGIGTTSPNRLIHGAGATPILKLDSTNNESYIQLVTASPSNESYIGLVSGDIYMSITGTGATGNEKFRIKANGRVGINNASPAATLSVHDPNGDNVTLFLNTTAGNNYIQLSDNVNNHVYIAKENSSNKSQVAIYATTSTGNGTGRVGRFDYRGLVLDSGKGIVFDPHDNTATTNGSDSNHLNDYEEGTFAATLPNASGVTVTGNSHYIKIGKMVKVFLYIHFTGTFPNDSNGFVIGGLPYNANGAHHGFGQITYSATHDLHVWRPLISGSSNQIYFHRTDGSGATLGNSGVQGLPSLIVGLLYDTN